MTWFSKNTIDQHQQMTLHPNHHRLWKLNTGLQETCAMSYSTLAPDSRTLVFKWITKLALIWKEDFGPLGNSPDLLLRLISYTTACSSSCQYPANPHSHWRGVDQHPTGHYNNLINSMRRRCVALCEANGGHTRYWLVFWPPRTLQYSKTAF